MTVGFLAKCVLLWVTLSWVQSASPPPPSPPHANNNNAGVALPSCPPDFVTKVKNATDQCEKDGTIIASLPLRMMMAAAAVNSDTSTMASSRWAREVVGTGAGDSGAATTTTAKPKAKRSFFSGVTSDTLVRGERDDTKTITASPLVASGLLRRRVRMTNKDEGGDTTGHVTAKSRRRRSTLNDQSEEADPMLVLCTFDKLRNMVPTIQQLAALERACTAPSTSPPPVKATPTGTTTPSTSSNEDEEALFAVCLQEKMEEMCPELSSVA